MRLPLTRQQANVLYDFFTHNIVPLKPTDIAESLVYDIMLIIFRRLRAKVEALDPKAGFGIPLNSIEAKAYYVYFHQRAFPANCLYEHILIQQHINLINKEYA